MARRRAPKFAVKIQGNQQLQRRFREQIEAFSEAERRGTEAAGEYLYNRVYKAMSRTDYSLDDLASRGHPYSKKRASILTSRIPPLKEYMIHVRSGKLRKSLTLRINRIHRGTQKGFQAQLYFLNPPNYASGVFFGTRYTHPRDPINGIINLKHTRNEVSRLLRSGLQTAIR